LILKNALTPSYSHWIVSACNNILDKFGLDNYEYILKEHHLPEVKQAYSTLGPFDFTVQATDEFSEDERTLVEKFETRRSGNMFRGQVNAQGRPDGTGFKLFPNGSVYEGFFEDGQCHGEGRGVSMAGDVFQGNFKYDVMDGYGFYMWNDGRIFEGDWKQGRKNGLGRYFWCDGKVYDGEFKDNECHGKGKLFYPDGKVFEGFWR